MQFLAEDVLDRMRSTEMHAHKCEHCGMTWEHGEHGRGSDEAHKCPACGRGPFWQRYTED